MTDTENTGAKQGGRFQKGRSGNPKGKPKGARNRASLAAEALLDGEAEALTRKAIAVGLAGNVLALRLCLDRVLPPRRERATLFHLPSLISADDVPSALSSILAAVAEGGVTVAEAGELAKLLEAFTLALQAAKEASRKEQLGELFPGLPAW